FAQEVKIGTVNNLYFHDDTASLNLISLLLRKSRKRNDTGRENKKEREAESINHQV
ncbi:hypothetical protein EZS27_028867, partial [termite gut metagenome]